MCSSVIVMYIVNKPRLITLFYVIDYFLMGISGQGIKWCLLFVLGSVMEITVCFHCNKDVTDTVRVKLHRFSFLSKLVMDVLIG